MQPPSTLGQMTKKRSVSMGLPGPTMISHHAGLAGDGVRARHVLVAGERVRHQHGVGFVRVQRAVGLVGDAIGREPLAGGQQQRTRLGNVEDVAAGLCRLLRPRAPPEECVSHLHALPASRGRRPTGQQQKNRLETEPLAGRFESVYARGLFSELFCVAASRPAKSPRLSAGKLSSCRGRRQREMRIGSPARALPAIPPHQDVSAADEGWCRNGPMINCPRRAVAAA